MQIQNICLEMQSLEQEKVPMLEVREEVWCIKRKVQGHDKDHCLIFQNYLTVGGPIPLRPEAQAGPSVPPSL